MCFKKGIILAVSILCLWIGSGLSKAEDAVSPEDTSSKKMVVKCTGYYKPSPRQSAFLHKSYEKEVAMNGNGLRTSSGSVPKIGTISADPKIFPIGTRLFVPGYGWGIVEDTGGKIKGLKIDLFMGEAEAGLKKALSWGRRKVVVEVLQD